MKHQFIVTIDSSELEADISFILLEAACSNTFMRPAKIKVEHVPVPEEGHYTITMPEIHKAINKALEGDIGLLELVNDEIVCVNDGPRT